MHIVPAGDTATLRSLLNDDQRRHIVCEPSNYHVTTPLTVNRTAPKLLELGMASITAVSDAIHYSGHPQGSEGKSWFRMTGGFLFGGTGAALRLDNPNFIHIEGTVLEGFRVGLLQRNLQPGSWSEHNTYRDLRFVNCQDAVRFDRRHGNPSMRGTRLDCNIYGATRPVVAKDVDLYSSELTVSMWAKPSTGTGSLCMQNTGIRGTRIELQHEDPTEIGVYLDSPDAYAGEIRAHFAHDCKVYGILTDRTIPPVTRFTYDPGVTHQPATPWV